MRSVDVSIVTRNIKEMCIQANHFLSEDMDIAMKKAVDCLLYTSPSPRDS